MTRTPTPAQVAQARELLHVVSGCHAVTFMLNGQKQTVAFSTRADGSKVYYLLREIEALLASALAQAHADGRQAGMEEGIELVETFQRPTPGTKSEYQRGALGMVSQIRTALRAQLATEARS